MFQSPIGTNKTHQHHHIQFLPIRFNPLQVQNKTITGFDVATNRINCFNPPYRYKQNYDHNSWIYNVTAVSILYRYKQKRADENGYRLLSIEFQSPIGTNKTFLVEDTEDT